MQGAFIEQHFDQDLNFLATEEDPVTKKVSRTFYFISKSIIRDGALHCEPSVHLVP